MSMRILLSSAVVLVACVAPAASADEVLYRYDCDVLPYDPSAGWEIFQPCDGPCSESLGDGHLVVYWADSGNAYNYTYKIAGPLDPPPPPTLWVEWHYRSDTLLGSAFGCDGTFLTRYAGAHVRIYMFGDAAISASGDDVVFGLDPNDFHSFRYESWDGINYRISVDGLVFIQYATDTPNSSHYLQFGGVGGCVPDDLPTLNEWDFIRFGTISSGEQIIATDPPAGYLDPLAYADLDRFTITFDVPGYVYLDDITVEVSGGTAPTVIQTRRLDNGEPEVVEIVLDGPMPVGQTTRFTFDDGSTVNVVEYTLATDPSIPTLSTWGVVVMTLLMLTAGSMIFARERRAFRNGLL